MSNEYYRVRDSVREKIDGLTDLEEHLKNGYVVTEVIDLGSNHFKIITHSPKTFEEYRKAGGTD